MCYKSNKYVLCLAEGWYKVSYYYSGVGDKDIDANEVVVKSVYLDASNEKDIREQLNKLKGVGDISITLDGDTLVIKDKESEYKSNILNIKYISLIEIEF